MSIGVQVCVALLITVIVGVLIELVLVFGCVWVMERLDDWMYRRMLRKFQRIG
jgi:NhaP-type Na+/H+ or K+/H+ antiporter